MSRKSIVIVICILISLVGAFTIWENNFSGSDPVKPYLYASGNQDRTVPEPVLYGFLFSKVSRLSEKTRELRAKGKIWLKPYFPLQKEIGLSEGQARALESI